ncbi:MAG: ribonuclease P protein component [Bacteroidota bacterium]|nr:ribonuclease P protein component [Bacteroidota bacterium]
MNHLHSFSKPEHLCGEKRITRVFTQGEAFIVYPLRVVYLIEPKNQKESSTVLVSVPKKRFKRAVKRNRLKRLMREAYRLNKQAIIEKLMDKQLQIQLAFNYVSDEEMDFAMIEKKMKLSLQKLADKIDLL